VHEDHMCLMMMDEDPLEDYVFSMLNMEIIC